MLVMQGGEVIGTFVNVIGVFLENKKNKDFNVELTKFTNQYWKTIQVH